MTPTLKQLRYLVAVADTLHFRRAAELTHVSQPTLSGQLRELEQRLGVQLVERSRAVLGVADWQATARRKAREQAEERFSARAFFTGS